MGCTAASHDEKGLARQRAQPRVGAYVSGVNLAANKVAEPTGSASSFRVEIIARTSFIWRRRRFPLFPLPRVLRNAELGLAALEVENVCSGIPASRKRREAEQISAEAAPVSRGEGGPENDPCGRCRSTDKRTTGGRVAS
jgi:hypothetical protein